jgi:site-specific DNA-adenine methylase
MKNHFLFSYTGNKRNETKNFLDIVKLDNIENIIEPFCGSSALSYSIWLENKDGKALNYYLNDTDERLIQVYNIMKNETIEHIEEKINNIIKTINNKEEWTQKLKSDREANDIYHFIFFKKYSMMNRYGFYPNDFNTKCKTFKITKETKEFIEFIKQPYVYITNNDWFDVFDKYKDDEKTLFIVDPPYIMSCNDFYTNNNLNMYQYFYDNKIENFKSKIYLILEDNWMIRLLFDKNVISKYSKKYELSKKQTNHIIIYNKK